MIDGQKLLKEQQHKIDFRQSESRFSAREALNSLGADKKKLSFNSNRLVSKKSLYI